MAQRGSLHRMLQSLSLDNVKENQKELGRGAYGVVYEVKVSGLVCAGKTLHEAIIKNETLDKFAEECLCHSQQRHPNIVQLMGVHFSRHSRLPMLVMEYLPLSLTQCLETHQDLSLQIKYSILLDVAKGLNYLHCKRPPIVHRDLTANNILLTSNFIAKISDLGVSRMADTFKQHHLTTAPGNAVVMPPEALKDNPTYDHKLDVFSYGCLTLHVLTQQWPTPTAQYIRKQYDPNSFSLVSEWDRRANYTTVIYNDNPFFLFTKSCLDNNPKKRPTMSDAIICAQHAVSSLPPLKNTLEMINNIDILAERVCQLERQTRDNSYRWEKKRKELEVKLKSKDDAIKVLRAQCKGIVSNYQLQKMIQQLLTHELKEGDEWYLVDADWLIQWKRCVDYDPDLPVNGINITSTQPDPVYNGNLFKDIESEILQDNLKEEDDYVLLPKVVWDLFVSWYGLSVGSRPICRYVMQCNKDLKVGIYPFEVKLCVYPHLCNAKVFSFCEKTTFGTVIQKTKKIFNVSTNKECRLWIYGYIEDVLIAHILLIDLETSSDKDSNLREDEIIFRTYMLEVRNPDGSWPKNIKLKLCIYPNINDIKLWSFDVFDTVDTVIQKTRELFNISTTNECRLWYWNAREDVGYLYNTLSDLKERVIGTCSIGKEENVYVMLEFVLNNKMPFILEVRNPDGSWPWRIELCLLVGGEVVFKTLSFGVFNNISTVFKKMSDLVSANECSLFEDDDFDKPFAGLILYVKNSDGSLSNEVTSLLYRDEADTKWLVKDRSFLDIINQEMLSENTNGIYYVMTFPKGLLTPNEEDN